FNKGGYIGLHFPAEEIEEIIQNPFLCKGLELEEALTQELRDNILGVVDDTLNAASASILPLVSVTLSRMYDHWQAQDAALTVGAERRSAHEPENGDSLSRQFSKFLSVPESATVTIKPKLLTLSEYKHFTNFALCIDQLGAEALSQAEKLSRNLRNQERALARILRRLVTPSSSDLKLFDLRPAVIPTDLRATPIFSALLDKRLIVEGSWNRVRLVHESVLDHWAKAREWANEERDLIRIRTQLMLSAGSWKDNGRSPNLIAGLGENEINGAARLLSQWGDDFAAASAQQKLDTFG
ncbi:MAG TPA: hypothetical protein VF290_19965, partial [Pyrinomonadaceae bacterium]